MNVNIYGRCPDCKNPLAIEFTPSFDENSPFERICYTCGWFDEKRYKSLGQMREIGQNEAKS